jgi:hypothetical protein
MEIPAIYSVLKGGEVRAAPVAISGADISFGSDPAVPNYSVEEMDDRMPVVVVDVKGLGKGNLDDKLLTNIRFPGSDVWFLSYIYNIEDVFDCFMGNIVKALIPYHTTASNSVMKDIHDVSDDCIPVLFIARGKVICRGGQTNDIMASVEELARTGFIEIIIFDTDSTMMKEDWIRIYDRFQGIIPFIRNKDASLAEIGVKAVISDLR